MKGYVQVYTGNGKGKTTASLGLTLRALGAGLSVFIGQFLKNGDYSEIKMLEKMKSILEKDQLLEIRQYGEPRFIKQNPSPADVESALKGWKEIQSAVLSGHYNLVIAEELNVALKMKLIPLEEVLALIQAKPGDVELVLTGRYAPDSIIEAADLVSEVQEIKHYYQQGIQGRTGIEK
ncbi:cob(I)yrinic acid a,c-diamide adenosyltransferase [Oceanispirochaeta sp.]|jgi:cob(I)alamin adenosyltransferase|uniref:cob(I)yrinic acid a,c-diamide adenosyltransferase n=1 Tax=Oceanispirochaeta sp. TaxID=2035350 RepID=UPI00260E481D|nr:cob(I)yrinic acid a,c-diamide adenosyltransferase [Oceanispirochaeta sp.]MDA3956824.1 cob(I)yrinic acid a,c-diamide adenosyltransferase [Oceanispirochaeta sp.]